MLAEQALQRRVQVLEVRRPLRPRLHVVPDLVREALHVVGQVAGEIDDRRAEPGRGLEAGGLEARFDESREAIGRNLLQAHHRSGLVERPALAEHPLHQRRFGAGEDVADLALLLHRGAQRVLDAAAVERRDGLELVERDRHPAAPGLGDPSRQREDLLREMRDVAIGPDRGKETEISAAPGLVGLDADLGPDARQHLAQPRARAIEPGFGGRQGAGVALEKGDVRAVAADLTSTVRAPLRAALFKRLADERRLAVAARRDEEDLLAGIEVAAEPVELDLAVDEGRGRNDLAVDEGIGHAITPKTVTVT